MAQKMAIFEEMFSLIREFERQFRDQGDMDLSTTQFEALTILSETQPMTAMALASRLRIAGPTATRALDSLERRGYVIKERDPQDRRLVWVQLTRRGEDALISEVERQRQWIEKLLITLSDEECDTLLQLLSRMMESVESS